MCAFSSTAATRASSGISASCRRAPGLRTRPRVPARRESGTSRAPGTYRRCRIGSRFTRPSLRPASASPRFSSARASDTGRAGANPIMNACAVAATIPRASRYSRARWRPPRSSTARARKIPPPSDWRAIQRVALGGRSDRPDISASGTLDAVAVRDLAHGFGKREALHLHHEVEDGAARAASEAMKKSALGIDRKRRGLFVDEMDTDR